MSRNIREFSICRDQRQEEYRYSREGACIMFRVGFHNVKHLSRLEYLSQILFKCLKLAALVEPGICASHIMKRCTCIFTLILQLLLYTLLTSTAALRTSIPQANAPILQVANSTLTSTGLVPLGTRVPFDYQGLTLVFTNFGKTIPQAEVKDTLGGASKLVQEYLDRAPEEGIPQNRFEYRLPQGHVLFAIRGLPQRGITWRVLYRVLQALDRFMVALRPPLGPHYQELNFDIQIAGSGWVVGNGLIWYFPPDSDDVQKRTTTTPISPISDESLLAFNASSGLINNEIYYPIPETSMVLHFYYIGLSLPPTLVTLNLERAIEEARIYSFGPFENETIRDGWFRSRIKGATSVVATTVFASENHQISWRQLYYVLDGLRLFVIGQRQSTTHYQTLGCRIVDDEEGKIGVATLAYFDPGPPPGVEHRAIADRKSPRALALTKIAKPTNQTTLGVIKDSIPVPLQWPIPDTDLTLIFKVFGGEILLIELITLLGAGQLRIASKVQRIPNEPIGSFRHQNGPGTLVMNFVTYDGKTITWLQLHEILVGLIRFCSDDHSRASFFEIDAAGHGATGFGVITTDPIGTTLQKRDSGRDYLSTSNSTFTSPENATEILGTPPKYPIPGTPITLNVVFLGVTPISTVELAATLTSALRMIEPHVLAEGAQAVPENQWMYEDRMTKIVFNLVFCPARTLLWQELSWVLIGIMHWMTAEGSDYCKGFVFDVQIEGREGLVGDGYVLHDTARVASGISKLSTMRSGESSALEEEMSSAPAHGITLSPSPATRQSTSTLRRQNPVVKRDFDLAEWSRVQGLLAHPTQLPQTLPARSVPSSNKTNLTLPIPYRIPNTNIILRIQVLPTAIPAGRIVSIFTIAREMLAQEVEDHPDDYFDENVFFSELKYLGGRELVAIEVYPLVNEHLTNLQLYTILVGLQLFIDGAEGRPFRHSLTIKVDIDGAYVACGQLSYFFRRPTTNTALTARSPPPPNATLTEPIPYPIIGTPITLAFTTLAPTPIPIESVREFFIFAFDKFEQQLIQHGGGQFKEYIWNYHQYFPMNRDMSLSIYRMYGKIMTWKNLGDILDGVDDFMEGKWRAGPSLQALEFDIEIMEHGVVGRGELLYVPRRSGVGGVVGVSEISNDTSTS